IPVHINVTVDLAYIERLSFVWPVCVHTLLNKNAGQNGGVPVQKDFCAFGRKSRRSAGRRGTLELSHLVCLGIRISVRVDDREICGFDTINTSRIASYISVEPLALEVQEFPLCLRIGQGP